MSCNHDNRHMDSCYLCTKCLDEQEAELARVKQENAELRKQIPPHMAIVVDSAEALEQLQQAKEAGARTAFELVAKWPEAVDRYMEKWRKREAQQDDSSR